MLFVVKYSEGVVKVINGYKKNHDSMKNRGLKFDLYTPFLHFYNNKLGSSIQ